MNSINSPLREIRTLQLEQKHALPSASAVSPSLLPAPPKLSSITPKTLKTFICILSHTSTFFHICKWVPIAKYSSLFFFKYINGWEKFFYVEKNILRNLQGP